MKATKKLLTLTTGGVLASTVLLGSPAMAESSVELPGGAHVLQVDGVEVVVAPHNLTKEELLEVGEVQSSESVDNVFDIMTDENNPLSEEMNGQIIFDGEQPGVYTAAVLVTNSPISTFGNSIPGPNCKTGARSGLSKHQVGNKITQYSYCGSGTWTGERSKMTSIQGTTKKPVKFGRKTNKYEWVCPAHIECIPEEGPITLRYVNYG